MPSDETSKRDLALNARRRHILDAAIACFLEKGYHQTGVRDIATRAGVSLGNLYNHFSGKYDMLVRMAELEAAEFAPFVAMLNGPGAIVERLKAFIQAFSDYFAHRDVTVLNLEITTEAMRQSDIAALFLDVRKNLAEALASLIDQGIEDGCFRSTIKSIDTAHFTLDLIENASCRCVIEGTASEKQQAALVEFLLSALMKKTD